MARKPRKSESLPPLTVTHLSRIAYEQLGIDRLAYLAQRFAGRRNAVTARPGCEGVHVDPIRAALVVAAEEVVDHVQRIIRRHVLAADASEQSGTPVLAHELLEAIRTEIDLWLRTWQTDRSDDVPNANGVSHENGESGHREVREGGQ